MGKVKVLSLRQPWASLVVMRAKKIETRSFQTKYRGKLYIHASQGFPKWARNMASYPPFTNYISSHQQLPLGHIIGSVDVVDCIHTADLQNILSSEERAFGDFTLGRWGWMLSNAAQLEQPIKASGSLGLWSFDMLEEFEPDYIGPDEKEVSNG